MLGTDYLFGEKNWAKKRDAIDYYVSLLEKYRRNAKKRYPSIRTRKPILAIWFWKKNGQKTLDIDGLLVDSKLENRLNNERIRHKGKAEIIYGPRKNR
jgi:hypothetical protein